MSKSVSTSTKIVNGRRMTVTKTKIQKPDGNVEEEVKEIGPSGNVTVKRKKTGVRIYNTKTAKPGEHCPWACEIYTRRNETCDEMCEERREIGEQCPIKKAGLEHNCNEQVEFENHEALELHNLKTGKLN